jgi:protein-S-isoprenylcysteine O-methyltransferase Ste14
MAPLLGLGFGWAAWCTCHSLLISPRVERWIREVMGARVGAFRLLYNLFSLATLAPLVWMHWRLRGPWLVAWREGWVVVPVTLNLLALALFVLGAFAHDNSDFLGIRSALSALKGVSSENRNGLSTGGILGWVRHPWYAGTLLLLWGHDLDAPGFVTSVILTVYILIGTVLEERKLVASFGEAYRKYQMRVPMFIPRRPQAVRQ